MKNLNKLNKKDEGAALIEFAIVLPLLLILIFGTIEFGLYLFNTQVLTNAAREGARRGVIMRSQPRSVSEEDAAVVARVMQFVDNNLVTFGNFSFGEDDIIVYSVVDESTGDPMPRVEGDLGFGKDLIVTANFTYDFLFISTLGIGPIDIKPVSRMKME
ncbi:TadE/TadG family type IV pilus assembly protein [Desulfobacula phenolica]|uniref:TadE-like protein n=1 Tax=Desulfobacula phenolica TaxID=90732 RepID=A0A1H2ES11_9BACT|nr:TadE family protein [Desulfobacula phenolica]SDT97865.1 TadE-like protein [Desulfobacula phenolica]